MDFSKRELWAGALVASAASTAQAETALGAAPPPEPPFSVWLAINRATQGYADCIDRLDMPGLAALFTPDCVFDYAPGFVMKGREGVAAGAGARLGTLAKTSHMVGPPSVEPGEEPGTYRSTVYFIAYHQQKAGPPITLYGRYVDLFKADASGRWLIAHRQTIGHAAEGGGSGPRYWLPRLSS